ncbi:hypothetical protein [Nisaea sp.]|uniref:hypothetical protein n=1 Tax=Nisaea sp. TaxID=2024842 RepID=UPI0032985666
MNTTQTLIKMRAGFADLLKKGQKQILTSALIKYLDGCIERSKGADILPIEFEKLKAALQKSNDDHTRRHEFDLENFRSVINMGQNAIKASMLLNGGASVAMLAFIADLAKGHPALVPDYAFCMSIFVFGALLATVLSGLTYLSQWLYADGKIKLGHTMQFTCISTAIASYGFFIWGLYETYREFLLFPATG